MNNNITLLINYKILKINTDKIQNLYKFAIQLIIKVKKKNKFDDILRL